MCYASEHHVLSPLAISPILLQNCPFLLRRTLIVAIDDLVCVEDDRLCKPARYHASCKQGWLAPLLHRQDEDGKQQIYVEPCSAPQEDIGSPTRGRFADHRHNDIRWFRHDRGSRRDPTALFPGGSDRNGRKRSPRGLAAVCPGPVGCEKLPYSYACRLLSATTAEHHSATGARHAQATSAPDDVSAARPSFTIFDYAAR